MVVHTCNPSIWRMRQQDHRFEASQGYTARPCSKICPHPKQTQYPEYKSKSSYVDWIKVKSAVKDKEN